MAESKKQNRYRRVISILISILLLLTAIETPLALSRTFQYDENGNLIQGYGKCYQYNSQNKLSKVTDCNNKVIAQYWYDHTGRRIKKIENGITTYYPFPDYEERIYPDRTKEKSIYVRVNGEIVARIDIDKNGNKKKFFYHPDHLGSTNIITNESGDLVEKTTYYPFGRTKQGGTQSKYLFTGQEFDFETNLYYYKARYYSPDLRRFVQPDPIVQDIYDPQSLNRYSYVRNNPVRYTDPSGNIFDTVLDIGFILYDVYEISQDPGNAWNWGALVVDVGCAFIPFATGGGRAVKALEHGGDIGKALGKGVDAVKSKIDDVVEWVGSKIDNLLGGGRRADDISKIIREADNPAEFLKKYNKGANPNAGKTVLGSLGDVDTYIAKNPNANYLNIHDEIYDILKSENKWEPINKQFLDEAIERGDKIVFATNPNKARPDSWFAWELRYLESRGYEILEYEARKIT